MTRKEHDSLGEIEVPSDALYGAQTARAVANFPVSGRTAHPELIRAYLRVKRAAAAVNAKLGAVTPEIARLIEQGADELLAMDPSRWAAVFPVDPYQAGAGTSQNMNTNEAIANCANRAAGGSLGLYSPVHPNDHVNRSQSTNDSFPTAMRLALLEASRGLRGELEALAASFAAGADRWREIPKSARTHLQDAVPMTLGQEFGAYAAVLRRALGWLDASRAELSRLGIGGSAAGTGLTVPKGYPAAMAAELSRLTGEKLVAAENLCEAMQSQAPIAHYSSTLRLIALELTRICNDLRLMASGPMTGLAEILLPAVQPGSSIMPGKVNPSILEMANQTWFSVLGYDQAIAQSVAAGQFELNVMMPIMAYSGLEATRVATQALKILRTRCVDGIEINEPRLRQYFESTPQVATALSPRLGYEATAKLVQESLARGVSVIELVRERKLVPEAELQKLLDVRALTGQG
jgi:aspartate ammonia-lyase